VIAYRTLCNNFLPKPVAAPHQCGAARVFAESERIECEGAELELLLGWEAGRIVGAVAAEWA